jgi:uncharacterized protein involved in exopolysaccharide biosynthesis
MTVSGPNNEEQVLTLKDLLTNYFNLAKRGSRYWGRGLAIALLVVIGGMVWVVQRPRVFKSEATFEVIMDTGDRGDEEIQRLVDSRLNQVFGSRQYILDVIRRLHLYDHLFGRTSETKIFDVFGDAMARRVERNTVKISFIYKDGPQAQRTVQALMDLFRTERSIAARQTSQQALATVNAQLTQLETTLSQKQLALDDFTRANEAFVEEIRREREGRVVINQPGSAAPAQRHEDRSSIRTRRVRARVAELERAIELLRNPTAESNRPSEEPQDVQALREQLRNKDGVIAGYRAQQMTEAHPTMSAALRERAQMAENLRVALARHNSAAQNASQLSASERQRRIDSLQGDLARARIELTESVRFDEAAAATPGTTPSPAPVPQIRNPLTVRTMLEARSIYERLSTDLATTRQSYQELLRRKFERQAEFERARFAGGEQLRVIDPPSLPIEPEPPGRVKLAFIVCILASIIGLGTALISGFLDTRIYDSADLQRWGEVAELPFIPDLFIDVKGGAANAPRRVPDAQSAPPS